MKKNGFSIQKKIIVLLIAFSLVLIGVAMSIFVRMQINQTDMRYKETALRLSTTVAEVIDVDQFVRLRAKVESVYLSVPVSERADSGETDENKVAAYRANFDSLLSDPDYIDMKNRLEDIRCANNAESVNERRLGDKDETRVNKVSSVYLIFVDNSTGNCVYVVDASDEPNFPGCFDDLYGTDFELIKDPEKGLPPYTTDLPQYGWLVTAGVPIHDISGRVVGYAASDISMTEARRTIYSSILKMFGYLFAAMLMCCAVSFGIVHRMFVDPIKKLIYAAGNYNNDSGSGERDAFSHVVIKNHDELAELADSMKRMEHDINKKISELTIKDNELAVSQNAVTRMTELANKDGLTGVRNKTSYDNHVARLDETLKQNGKVEFGIVMVDLNGLKHINDTYGHNSGDIAIIKLSNIVCAIFAHSPVFRIGGDEFAVIIQNHDYNHSDELIEEINGKIERLGRDDSLKEYEKVSAAVGIAKFDPELDQCAADVFKRADAAMYEHKRAAKKNLYK